MILIGVTCVFLLGVGILMVQVLWSQLGNYQRLIDSALAKNGLVNTAVALGYARAVDSAVIKTCCVFLSFMLFLLGALYTFRAGESQFRLSAEGGTAKGSLETASPGLVMLTLGVVIISMTIWRENTIDLVTSHTSTLESLQPPVANTVAFHSTTAMPEADLKTIRISQIQAITQIMTILDVQKGALRSEQGKQWDDTRPKIDALRSELIVTQFPQLRGKWAEWKRQFDVNPDFAQMLSPEEAQQFKTAIDLISN